MRAYLKHIVNQLRNFSSTLDRTSILIDKPWALIDEDQEIQKLIFKSNKELVLSKNGQVQMGRWDYFPEAKSLLINRNQDIILCNEAFIDRGIMILRLDGNDNRFYVFVNENIVPDLDGNKYLKNLRYQRLSIVEKQIIDGRILEIQTNDSYYPEVGNIVTENAVPIEDGKYKLAIEEKHIEIKNNRIYKILISTKYTNPAGQEIIIQQQDYFKINHGDYLFIDGIQIENAIISFTKSKNIVVKNGIVIRTEFKNKTLKWLSKEIQTFFATYED